MVVFDLLIVIDFYQAIKISLVKPLINNFQKTLKKLKKKQMWVMEKGSKLLVK